MACAEKAGVGGEALPHVVQGLKAGIATRQQIARAVGFATEYYDFELARVLASSLKTARHGQE